MTNDKNFSGTGFGNKAKGFDTPTQLPASDEEHAAWQAENKAWWESTPMRYDWREGFHAEPGTASYFDEIDRRFFASAEEYLPKRAIPFDSLVDFTSLAGADVLEIGVGHGSHAELLARHARSFIGIDLTEAAQAMTSKRFAVRDLPSDIRQMDAEALAFDDESFDFVWSWGVVHHSANTASIIKEVARVLRPGGRFVAMVYNRSLWKYLIFDGLFRGLLAGDLFRKGSLHRVAQAGTDGAIARYYNRAEWRALCSPYLEVEDIRILGQKYDLFPFPAGMLKERLVAYTPNRVARFFTNHLRFGSFLVGTMRKACSQTSKVRQI